MTNVPIDAAPLAGKWEGTWKYDHTEPANCPVIGLFPNACPSEVPITLTVSQSGDKWAATLLTTIYGAGGTQVFELGGALNANGDLVLSGEQTTRDSFCMRTGLRRMTPWTLRRTSAKSLAGDFTFQGDQRISSCYFNQPVAYSKELLLHRIG